MYSQNRSLRFRQVHLDFHTHQAITGIGSGFDPDRFADTMAAAHVDSVTLFARCHHGYVYYRSKKFAAIEHPGLERDLLREQIAACHARDIKTPVYITVQWDALNAGLHPEWLCRARDGRLRVPAGEPGFYNHLCVNTSYREWLKDFTSDVLENTDGDGLFFDIVVYQDCFCTRCMNLMHERDIDPMDEKSRHTFAYQTIVDFQREMTAHVNSIKPGQSIFYNSGHIGPSQRERIGSYTHLEVESLPFGWGYDHFPCTARYVRTLGVDFLGMTGKFHTVWGDFHSFKTPQSLKYECCLMLALGGKCSIGDQLPPGGEPCRQTYDLIGGVYSHVESCEQFCRDASPVADIAVISPEAFIGLPVTLSVEEQTTPSARGAGRLLRELHHQYDFVDTSSDLKDYRLLILPDNIPVDERINEKISNYIADGGSVIASHRSGYNPDSGEFVFDNGVLSASDCEYEPSFVVPSEGFAPGLPLTEYVMHRRGMGMEGVSPESTVLASHKAPYFNRTYRHYCSHLHAPSSGKSLGPSIVQKGRVIYFAHPIFSQFDDNAPPWVRTLFSAALKRLLPEPAVIIENGPTTLFAAVNDQPSENRRILHLMHAIPVSNARLSPTISDEIMLYNLQVSLKTEKNVRSLFQAPEGGDLPFRQEKGRINFTVPAAGLHTMVVVQM